MTSMRKSNRTMLASIIALSLCFVLLLGATLAWFEATVVNSGNSVTAGAYGSDMDLEVLGEDDVTWNDVENPFFACTNWMPGSTAVKVLRVSNTGDTHLYWDLSFVKTADEANLSDVIDVYYKWDVDKNTTDITGWEKIGTMTECITDGKLGQVLRGELYAGETRNLALALQMEENAGAQYQEKLLTFNISMYITDKPFAGWAVKDSVAVTPDAEGKLTEGATISASTPDENAVVSEAVVTVPAGVAIAEGASTLKLSVTEGTVPNGVEIGDGREAIALNISLDGLSPDNDQPVTVTLTIEQGLQNVVLYHNGVETPCTYDAATGVLTFTTTSFSPFTIVHGAPVALPTYTVKFVDWNGDELKTETVEEGAAATAPADPTREGYTFKAWDKAFDNVTENLTVTATYEINKYTVTWVIDGETIKTETLDYGTAIVAPAAPEKQADAQYTYEFAGWGEVAATVTKDVTYTSTYNKTVNEYTVTFKNGETVLQTGKVAYGATPTYTETTVPSKASTAEFSYAFAGWSTTEGGEALETLLEVTGDATYYAVFTAKTNAYTVIFKNEDGTELQKSDVAYGETPEYTGDEPTKAATAQYTYTFAGWNPTVSAVTGEVTYTATFTETVNKYTVTWVVGDTETEEEYEYGATPSYKGTTPVKTGDAQYSYTFKDWGTIVKVEGDATYTATFTQTVNTYTITWVIDGAETKETYEYGKTPAHADPVKAADEQYTYEFAGWTPAIEAVSGDATYTAEFTATPVATEPAVDKTWIPGEGTNPGTEAAPLQLDEALDWSKYESVTVWVYHKTNTTTPWPDGKDVWINLYKAEDGSFVPLFGTVYIPRGDEEGRPVGGQPLDTMEDGEQAIPVTFELGDLLDGYTGALYLATRDNTWLELHKVTFEVPAPKYTVTWVVEGQENVTETYKEGATPAYPNGTPTKADDAEYTYTFKGWTPEVVAVTGDVTYTAEFTATPIPTEPAVDITWLPAKEGTAPGSKTAPLQLHEALDWSKYESVTVWVYHYKNTTTSWPGKNVWIDLYKLGEDGSFVSLFGSPAVYLPWGTVEGQPLDIMEDGEQAIPVTFALGDLLDGYTGALYLATMDNTYLELHKVTFTVPATRYTVTWVDGDGETIRTDKVASGSTPVYTGTTPTKAADDQYVYTFAGWDKELTPVTGDVTYTAQFDASLICKVTFVNSDGTTNVQTVGEGAALPSPATMVGSSSAMVNTSATAWKDSEGNVYYYNYYISTQSEAAAWTDANGDPVDLKVTGDMTLTQWSVVVDLSTIAGSSESSSGKFIFLGSMSLSNPYDLGKWNLSQYSAVRFTYGASSATMSAHEVQLFTKDGDTSTTVASASLADTTGSWFTGAPTVTIDLSEVSGEYTNLYIGTTSSVGCYRIEFISVN